MENLIALRFEAHTPSFFEKKFQCKLNRHVFGRFRKLFINMAKNGIYVGAVTSIRHINHVTPVYFLLRWGFPKHQDSFNRSNSTKVTKKKLTAALGQGASTTEDNFSCPVRMSFQTNLVGEVGVNGGMVTLRVGEGEVGEWVRK